MAVEAIFNNPQLETSTPAELSVEPVSPGVKEWATKAFDSIRTHALQLAEPSLNAIDKARREYANRRGLARLSFAIFDQGSEMEADRDHLAWLSERVKEANGDRDRWRNEMRLTEETIAQRQGAIEKLQEEKVRWTGGN
jgi:hypothetical protein